MRRMSNADSATASTGPSSAGTMSPADVARTFLEALADEDLDAALALVADDIVYTNVGMPSLHGRHRLERAFRPLLGRFGFRVHFHNVAAEGSVVLTERTDALVIGRMHWQFWVYGRFEVVDGRITVWRDSFDYVDVTVGLVRGLLALRWPHLGRRWPDG